MSCNEKGEWVRDPVRWEAAREAAAWTRRDQTADHAAEERNTRRGQLREARKKEVPDGRHSG
jgi:hypothetical protein